MHLLKYDHEDGLHAVVLDDDGRVAYAYLLLQDKIMADVWLYNRCPAPASPEWNTSHSAPFANCASNVGEDPFVPPASEEELSIEWCIDASGEVKGARILIRGQLHATLALGDRPGCCRLAKRDSPVAKTLRISTQG